MGSKKKKNVAGRRLKSEGEKKQTVGKLRGKMHWSDTPSLSTSTSISSLITINCQEKLRNVTNEKYISAEQK